MRITVDLADDVVRAVEELRRDRSMGLSQAVDQLIRAGMITQRRRPPLRQPTAPDPARGARVRSPAS